MPDTKSSLDKSLLIITILNYTLGSGIEYYFIKTQASGLVLFSFPFFWLGFVVIAMSLTSDFQRLKDPDPEYKKEKVVPNIIMLIINALFPLIALVFIGLLS